MMKKAKKAVSYNTAKQQEAKKNKYYKIIALIGFFVLWEAIGRMNGVYGWFKAALLPMPSEIIESAVNFLKDGTLFTHLSISVNRVLLGYVIGVLVAVVLGTMIASSRLADNIISPIINLLGPIPVMAFLPMFILWFGIGENSKVILIAYATVIYMISYVVEGIRGTDPVLIRSALSLGATKIQVFWHVKFQSAFPNIFLGMKGALGTAFGAMVVAEMLGASTGLGYIIVFSKNWFKMSDMMMAAILIGLLYTLIFAVLTLLENVLFKWKKKSMGNAVE